MQRHKQNVNWEILLLPRIAPDCQTRKRIRKFVPTVVASLESKQAISNTKDANYGCLTS